MSSLRSLVGVATRLANLAGLTHPAALGMVGQQPAALALGAVLGTIAVISASSIFKWAQRRRRRRVFVSGCFDLLHTGHVAFFKDAAQLGDLYVSVGNDANVTALKQKPMFPEDERVYMVQAIRWVHTAFVAKGMGHDQSADLDHVRPHIFFVNADGDREIKRKDCEARGIEYVVASREPDAGLTARSSTSIKAELATKS